MMMMMMVSGCVFTSGVCSYSVEVCSLRVFCWATTKRPRTAKTENEEHESDFINLLSLEFNRTTEQGGDFNVSFFAFIFSCYFLKFGTFLETPYE